MPESRCDYQYFGDGSRAARSRLRGYAADGPQPLVPRMSGSDDWLDALREKRAELGERCAFDA